MHPIRAINLLALAFVLASLAFGLANHCAALVSAGLPILPRKDSTS